MGATHIGKKVTIQKPFCISNGVGTRWRNVIMSFVESALHDHLSIIVFVITLQLLSRTTTLHINLICHYEFLYIKYHGFFIVFQVIIPVSWIFALIMESPGFLSSDYKTTLGICIMDFTEEWMGKAFSVVWFLVFGGLPIPLMLALYSTVVYNLWFKRKDQNGLSFQQKV